MKEHPYDALHDDYDVLAFDHPIETTKATAIYGMHTYWSKKPHDAIQEYITHYTKPGDLVLDPFCGSGSTALAALIEGRAAVAIDLSPAATFITKNYCAPVDTNELARVFEELENRVKPQIDPLYETRCDSCGGPAHTLYTVYSRVFQCPECGEEVVLFDCPVEAVDTHGSQKEVRVCPHCLSRGKLVKIGADCARLNAVPVLVCYECDGDCRPRRRQRLHNDPDEVKQRYFHQYDVRKLQATEMEPIPYSFPTDRMMNLPLGEHKWGVLWREGVASYESVDQLFAHRSLIALSILLHSADEVLDPTLHDMIRFAFSGSILNASLLYRNREMGGGSPTNLSQPGIFREMNPWYVFKRKCMDVLSGKQQTTLQTGEVCISTESATRFVERGEFPEASVDYIFTDPPYSGKYPYGELNFIWECWLGLNHNWQSGEITIADDLDLRAELRKTSTEWAEMMKESLTDCYRVLKPGRHLTLCYHDSSEGTWQLVQDIMAGIGFVPEHVDATLYIDTNQKTHKQRVAGKVTKRDLVINFRKPRPGEIIAVVQIDEADVGETLNDKVRAVITDYLTDHPGATKDRIWDTVVSRMVREGQMQSHDFEALLRDVANEVTEPVKKDLLHDEAAALSGSRVTSHWYLRSTAYVVEDEAERSKEDTAAAIMMRFVAGSLKSHPEQDGVHYSDLFEYYLTHVTDKPRRKLVEWLPDYFFFTVGGTWRLPATPDEEELKAHERQQGTGRRIRRYLAYLQHHADIPEEERPTDVTLADWIRHCKRAGMYAQGRELYEQGGLILEHLSEEQQVDVQEDYGVCVRKLVEQQVVPKRRKKAKEETDDLF